MASSSDSRDLSSSISKLSIETSSSTSKTAKGKSKAKKEEVADSWEDEDVSSGSGSDTETETQNGKDYYQGTAAPPPTPMTPTYDHSLPSGTEGGYSVATASSPGPPRSARPEKTDAVARRMIAGALGLKAPKLTDEQKAYQKAIKEKERKRREEEKAAAQRKEEEEAKARASIWED